MSGSTALERLGLTYSPAGSELGIELGRSPGMAPHLRGVPRHDEMVDARGDVRRSWRGVGQALGEVGPGGLRERARTIARLLADDGATYRAPTTGTERLWSLDPLPMVVDAAQWVGLERGLVQRAELLDHVLADLYGPRRLITSGLIPPEVVYGHPGFIRQVDGITLPAARQLFLASADLARDSAGQWRVLGDRTQAASGAGYAMENRGVLSRALPGLYRGTGVHRIAPFFHTMRRALQQLAPDDAAARVVLLTPGAHSETAFDQALLSSLLGFPLVEGADLTVRDGRVWQRSLAGLEPVDVILRRVDSDFCDPLELRAESHLGVPGLIECLRLGSVAVVNSLGSGVLENPGLFAVLPQVCRAVLGEPLLLASAETFWCGEPWAGRHVLDRMDHLVIKPISHAAGGSVLGWELGPKARAELRRRIEADPAGWVGQEPLPMSTAPTLDGDGLQPRPVTLRSFAVAVGPSYELMTGGLTRVGADRDSVVLSTASGAASKDVWVLSPADPPAALSRAERPHPPGATDPGGLGPETLPAAVSPRVAHDLYWLGRYAERAESLTRLLRIVDNRWRDLHPAPDPALAECLVVLLQTLTTLTSTWPGFVGEGSGRRLAAPEPELVAVIRAEDRVGSLAHDLRHVRQLATSVRDQLSRETWSVLAALDRGLAHVGDGSGRALGGGVTAGLDTIMQALLALSGLMSENLVHDAGWYLLDTGRRLERALQTVGLLRAGLASAASPAVEELVIESLLIAADSIITHRRRYPAGAGADTVLDLLLDDPGNPRSVRFQHEHIRADLDALAADAPADRSGPSLDRFRRRLLDLDATLAARSDLRRPADARTLISSLGEMEQQLRDLHDLIDTVHFAPGLPLQPMTQFATQRQAS